MSTPDPAPDRHINLGHHIVYDAIVLLTARKRTGNNSQLASMTGYSRTEIAKRTATLRQRGYIKDVSSGAAYHWRVTGKPMPPKPVSEPGPPALAKLFPLGG